MTWSGVAALALLPTVMVLLAGCESTQSKSAKLERASAGEVAAEKGLKVSRQSKDVKIGRTAAVADENGTAAVVEIRNATERPLVGIPVLIEARDARKKAVFTNGTPGLEPSLVSVAALAPGDSILWVNDQITGEGIKTVTAKAGKDKGNPPKRLPEIAIGEPKLVRDPTSGLAAEGKVTNRSKVQQRDLVVFAVARKRGRIVAAGRSVVERLRPGKSGGYQVFFIGNPGGAKVTLAAPPTVLK